MKFDLYHLKSYSRTIINFVDKKTALLNIIIIYDISNIYIYIYIYIYYTYINLYSIRI